MRLILKSKEILEFIEILLIMHVGEKACNFSVKLESKVGYQFGEKTWRGGIRDILPLPPWSRGGGVTP